MNETSIATLLRVEPTTAQIEGRWRTGDPSVVEVRPEHSRPDDRTSSTTTRSGDAGASLRDRGRCRRPFARRRRLRPIVRRSVRRTAPVRGSARCRQIVFCLGIVRGGPPRQIVCRLRSGQIGRVSGWWEGMHLCRFPSGEPAARPAASFRGRHAAASVYLRKWHRALVGDAARCVGAVRRGCRKGSCRLPGGGAIEARRSTHRWSGGCWFVLRRFDRGSRSVARRWSRVSIPQWHCRPGCLSAGAGGSTPSDRGAVGHRARLLAAVAPRSGNCSSGRSRRKPDVHAIRCCHAPRCLAQRGH